MLSRTGSRVAFTAVALALSATLGLTLTGCVGAESAAESASGWINTDTSSPVPQASVTPAPSLDPVDPDETSVAPRVVESADAGRLISAEVETMDGWDTLAFVFADGEIPSYDIRYVDRLERGVDDVVMLDGSAVLSVTFSDTSPGTDGSIPEEVAANDVFDYPVIRQVLLATNLGGTLTFGVGTATQAPFSVTVDGDTLTVSVQQAD